MEELIGKYAYKKTGFFSHVIGVIEKGNGISKYVLRFEDGGGVGFSMASDIVLVDKSESQ